MARALTLIVVVSLMATVGCANMTPTQQRALSGGRLAQRVGQRLGL
jgi:hypothetical protein